MLPKRKLWEKILSGSDRARRRRLTVLCNETTSALTSARCTPRENRSLVDGLFTLSRFSRSAGVFPAELRLGWVPKVGKGHRSPEPQNLESACGQQEYGC